MRLTGAIESKNRKVQIGPKLTWCVELLSSLRHASIWTNEIASKGVRRGHKVWNRGHTFRSTLITEIGDGKYCSTVGWLVFKMAWKEWKGVGKSKGSFQTNIITCGNKAEPTKKRFYGLLPAKRLWFVSYASVSVWVGGFYPLFLLAILVERFFANLKIPLRVPQIHLSVLYGP